MANLLSTIVSGRLSIGSSTATPYATTAPDGIVFGGNEANNYYRIYTSLEDYGGNYTKLNIAWHTGMKIGAYSGYGGIRFYDNSPQYGTEVFSVAKGDSNVRVTNTLIFSSSNGTMISNGAMSDAIGWNSSYGTYIGSTVGGTYYIYGNGRFYDNGTIRTLIHTGNIGSQSVNYASSAGDASTLGGYGRGNTTNKIAYWDSTRNLYVDNPESYSGEVRLGAAWGRGGVYASNTLSLSTSASQIHFVFSDNTAAYINSNGHMYAAIYYDSQDSAFYVNPNGYSNLSQVNTNELFIDDQKVLNSVAGNGATGTINAVWGLLKPNGKKIYPDEEFADGTNSVSIYNNNGGSAVSIVRKNSGFVDSSAANMPNKTGYVLEIMHAPTTSYGTSPGYGGWYFATWTAPSSSRLLCIFKMKVPAGRYLNWASNSIGSGGSGEWLTSNAGTGQYQDYAYLVHSGTSSFSSTHFFFITGGSSDTFYTYLASATVYDITDVSNDFVFRQTASADMRAPIFYDSQDLGYYVDPNATSNLAVVNVSTINPTNTYVGNAIYFGGGNNYLNWDGARINSNVGIQSTSDMRAPIFYDSANTGYYLDPNSGSNLHYVTANQSYVNGWFRNNANNTGLYNENTTMHLSSSDNGFWDISSTNTESSIRFYTGGHKTALRGYVYANSSNNIGFLDNSGNWSLRTDSSRNTYIYNELIVGYNQGSSSIQMYDSDEGSRYIHCNSNRIGFLTQAGAWGSWCDDDGNWTSVGNLAGAYLYSNYSVRVGEIWGFGGLYRSSGMMLFGTEGAGWSFRSANSEKVYIATDGNIYMAWAGAYISTLLDAKQNASTAINTSNIGSQSVNYATSAGSVAWSNVSSKPATWLNEPNLIQGSEPDTIRTSGFFESYLGSGNPTGTWMNYINVRHSNTNNGHGFQIGMSYYDNNLWFRSYSGNIPPSFQSWSRALGTNTDPYPSNMNQYVRTTDDVTHNSTTSPTFLVNNHSDNTKGYRIHNTSGSSVSAMFTNSSNQLVIAAGAVDQINLNKKVYVNGVALGVNVAPSATAGRIDASNDIVAYSSSDERLKENITPIENALDKVKSLTGVEFDWKPEYKHAHGYEGHDTGIIAQQVEAVMPSAVRTNDTGFLAVRYEKLIGLLIEANKELAARVEELEKKLG